MKSTHDELHMSRALSLAARGRGYAEPNPLVGCVIVQDEHVVAEGWHASFGGPHAEIAALQNATQSVRGGTLYVNLEPCCHYGKTPPCTEAIIKSGVRRVVAAMQDPFPDVAGRGFSLLQAAGIVVEMGVCQREARGLNAPFVKRVTKKLPWVIAKWAMTADGKIAARDRSSQWISNSLSRAYVHQLRGSVDAIVIGVETAIDDDPLLTARPVGPRTALRVILDRHARLPLNGKLVTTAGEFPTLVMVDSEASHDACLELQNKGCEVVVLKSHLSEQQIHETLTLLADRGATNVLLEGGARLSGSFWDAQAIDEVHIFVAPLLIGGQQAISPLAGVGRTPMSSAIRIVDLATNTLDGDIHLTGRIDWEAAGSEQDISN
ncbi:MAG: bifunctional diaminohydroxyphosphoribosylaminopyrimidine deaminase/5-amino-6-(5-phosphoribosylamino)uracil reductase RibD [Planctomycetota bacterium]|nr:bifunctional diaminohydroxyphosphoribosylaminopyrimidine deaminase/5-amino-6-(5-phosphoribosylamino)uracil reductase RibD [Planctomycetota bacterium]MDA1177449.1 bifunctional diaminohydroxyphosphoribosylaminopyrimidine deaminase/5-amino-6-(5-phosphoribosylamino)uracil reductase RibD [Planctomycetota bacterium]